MRVDYLIFYFFYVLCLQYAKDTYSADCNATSRAGTALEGTSYYNQEFKHIEIHYNCSSRAAHCVAGRKA
jgi:hypothetical protein